MAFNTDYLTYYDKVSHLPSTLGSVQVGEEGFNMSFVADGTKDSCRIIVHSYTLSKGLEPQTIVRHDNTNTWWVVASDKVERYINETGYYYVHSLNLIGAIELLNARDLTDCGFNSGRYTIESFIKRLFSLSTFEFNTTIDFGFLIGGQSVDFLKTFENYTLLSALREFLDAFNAAAILTFNTGNAQQFYGIIGANLTIFSKSGSNSSIDIGTFNDVKQITNTNKESFGSTVVSNAENVVSTSLKTYPTVGGIKISSTEYTVGNKNGLLRLPSNISEIKKITMISGGVVAIGKSHGSPAEDGQIIGRLEFDPTNQAEWENVFDWIVSTLRADHADSWLDNLPPEFWDDAKKESARETYLNQVSLTFEPTTDYDPINDTFTNGVFHSFKKGVNTANYVLGNKTLREGVKEPRQVMYWEKGSPYIKGFDFWDYYQSGSTITSAELSGITFVSFQVQLYGITYDYKIVFGSYDESSSRPGYVAPINLGFEFSQTRFKIDYVPMSDIKIKLDNRTHGNDIQLYNQNGKTTDSNAISKLLLSYSKEIENENLTKYKSYYNFSSIPLVGTTVKDNDKLYVINNISLQFYVNEATYNNGNHYDYYIEGEFTMSLYNSTKSMLVNPNTNIRDYGIPQNNTVSRTEVFRDFWEIDYYTYNDADNNIYMPLSKIINTSSSTTNNSHVAIIKTTFANGDSWYYQLETTQYYLAKSMYEVVNFVDNNIIGYDMQTVSCGFDITRILSGTWDLINTPVSYVDDKGEIKNLDIAFCNESQILANYLNQKERNHCFISQTTYDNSVNNCDFAINYTNYYKDALEIPVIEYSCQLVNTPNVAIGENIFSYYNTAYEYLYEFIFVPKGLANEYNFYSFVGGIDSQGSSMYIDNSMLISISQNEITLNFYDRNYVDFSTGNITLGNRVDITQYINENYDCLIVRHTVDINSTPLTPQLMFILKNLDSQQLVVDKTNGIIKLYANHYKIR